MDLTDKQKPRSYEKERQIIRKRKQGDLLGQRDDRSQWVIVDMNLRIQLQVDQTTVSSLTLYSNEYGTTNGKVGPCNSGARRRFPA